MKKILMIILFMFLLVSCKNKFDWDNSTKVLTDSGYKIFNHYTTKEELDELKSSLKLQIEFNEYKPNFECDFLEQISFGLGEYDLRAYFVRVKTSSQAKKLCKFYRYISDDCNSDWKIEYFDNVVFSSIDLKINELLNIEFNY